MEIPRLNEQDFGSRATYWLALRRVGWRLNVTCSTPVEEVEDFGIYLGEHAGAWYVAVKDFLTFKPKKLLAYDTLDDLKKEWELD